MVKQNQDTALIQPLATQGTIGSMTSEEGKKAKQKYLIMTSAKILAVPTALYAFSKYKGYDSGKTAKVTIIGSVIIVGAVVLNRFSGWSGTTFMDRTFGQQKFW